MGARSRLRAFIAIVAAAAIAGCMGTVRVEGDEQGDDGPGDRAQPGLDPESAAPQVDVRGPAPHGCGNGVCTPNESCSSCPGDCGACPCSHDACVAGGPLMESCDACVADICAVDGFCCEVAWDWFCVSEAEAFCGVTCPAVCGDGMCNASEGCSSCPQDCGDCPVCGDGLCDAGEACSSCPQDCGECSDCGNGLCDGPEDCSSCPGDCGACEVCGNGQCDTIDVCPGCDESCSTCPQDCGACAVCGDGMCEYGETCGACAGDCGACVCHGTCEVGPPLDPTCGDCAAQMCAVDSYCCEGFWDEVCVSQVESVCGTPCAK